MLTVSTAPENKLPVYGEGAVVYQLNRAYGRFTSSLIGIPQDVSDAIIAAGDDTEKVREIWNQYTNRFMGQSKTLPTMN